MARRRRKKGFLATFVSVILFSLAAYGGWTIYKQNEDEARTATQKTISITKQVVKKAKEISKALDGTTMAISNAKSGSWTCWFKPTKKALEVCRSKGKCSGVGTYGQHPTDKSEAMKLGDRLCKKTFVECEWEYCEQAR